MSGKALAFLNDDILVAEELPTESSLDDKIDKALNNIKFRLFCIMGLTIYVI